MAIRLGIIGISEGNGHPYSWSALFNGYNAQAMEQCGFPVIPRYLERHPWPDSKIMGATVTHVWTQQRQRSQHIAASTLIGTIVDNAQDMLGNIDALLLARDDAENHLQFAAPFLQAGLPVYIDKPIALSLDALEKLYALEQFPGQIFTCSALRYSTELTLTAEIRQRVGRIKEIHATTPKSWDKYSPHVIEPVLKMLGADDDIKDVVQAPAQATGGSLAIAWKSGIITRFFALGDKTHSPLGVRVFGEAGWHDFTFTDSFSAFKAALEDFKLGIENCSVRSDRRFNERVVSLIEAGR